MPNLPLNIDKLAHGVFKYTKTLFTNQLMAIYMYKIWQLNMHNSAHGHLNIQNLATKYAQIRSWYKIWLLNMHKSAHGHLYIQKTNIEQFSNYIYKILKIILPEIVESL